jgi:hypothetical protein
MCDTLGCGAACELHGECYKAKCYCDIGWGGTDCSTQLPSALAAAETPVAPAAAAGGASLKIKASFTANSVAELTAQEDGIKTAMAAWLGVSASDIAIEWASARRRLLATYGVRGAPLLGAAAACRTRLVHSSLQRRRRPAPERFRTIPKFSASR